jgi:hypothetical protein
VEGTFDNVMLAGTNFMSDDVYKRAAERLNPRFETFIPGFHSVPS